MRRAFVAFWAIVGATEKRSLIRREQVPSATEADASKLIQWVNVQQALGTRAGKPGAEKNTIEGALAVFTEAPQATALVPSLISKDPAVSKKERSTSSRRRPENKRMLLSKQDSDMKKKPQLPFVRRFGDCKYSSLKLLKKKGKRGEIFLTLRPSAVGPDDVSMACDCHRITPGSCRCGEHARLEGPSMEVWFNDKANDRMLIFLAEPGGKSECMFSNNKLEEQKANEKNSKAASQKGLVARHFYWKGGDACPYAGFSTKLSNDKAYVKLQYMEKGKADADMTCQYRPQNDYYDCERRTGKKGGSMKMYFSSRRQNSGAFFVIEPEGHPDCFFSARSPK